MTFVKWRCVCEAGVVDMCGESYQKHLGTCVKLDIVSPIHIRPGGYTASPKQHGELLKPSSQSIKHVFFQE